MMLSCIPLHLPLFLIWNLFLVGPSISWGGTSVFVTIPPSRTVDTFSSHLLELRLGVGYIICPEMSSPPCILTTTLSSVLVVMCRGRSIFSTKFQVAREDPKIHQQQRILASGGTCWSGDCGRRVKIIFTTYVLRIYMTPLTSKKTHQNYFSLINRRKEKHLEACL